MCLIWGVTWIALKFGIEEMPPLFFAAARFTVAGLVLSTILAAQGKLARPARADLPRLLACSLLMITGCYALLFWGMQFVASGLGGVIEMSLTPVALLGFALLLRDEQFRLARALAILLGVVGILVLFLPSLMKADGANSPIGIAAVSAAAAVYAWGAVLSRPLMARYTPTWLAAVTMIVGGLILLAIALAAEPDAPYYLTNPWPLPAFGGWLFLVIFGSLIGYTIYMHLLRVWGSSRSGSFAFLSSVVAVAAGYIVFDEPITPTSLAGMAILLVAAWLAMRPLKATPSE